MYAALVAVVTLISSSPKLTEENRSVLETAIVASHEIDRYDMDITISQTNAMPNLPAAEKLRELAPSLSTPSQHIRDALSAEGRGIQIKSLTGGNVTNERLWWRPKASSKVPIDIGLGLGMDYTSYFRPTIANVDISTRLQLADRQGTLEATRHGSVVEFYAPSATAAEATEQRKTVYNVRVWIDTERGCMPLKIEAFTGMNENARLAFRIESELEEVATGLWAPTAGEFTRYDGVMFGLAADKPTSRMVMSVDRAKSRWNPTVDDHGFISTVRDVKKPTQNVRDHAKPVNLAHGWQVQSGAVASLTSPFGWGRIAAVGINIAALCIITALLLSKYFKKRARAI